MSSAKGEGAQSKRASKSGTRKKRRRGNRRVRVVPGQTLALAVRCVRRHYLLRPDRETNQAFAYLLALVAKKYGIEVYAACVMRNHYHMVFRDVRGCYPNFLRDLNRMLAQFLKAKYRWTGSVFAQKPCRIVCLHPEAVVDKIAYTLANPVSAAAVRYHHEWPGFRTRIGEMGKRIIGGKRPAHFFGKRKTLPDEAAIVLAYPNELEQHFGSRDAANAAIQDKLTWHLERARTAIANKGWKYLGRERAMKLSPYKRAKGYEVFDQIKPQISTIGLTHQESILAKQAITHWNLVYDAARERFLDGEHVLWPAGTWAMVEHFGQEAEAPPLAA